MTVPSGVTLTIKPSSTLKFDANKRLDIKGELNAIGTGPSSILLTKRLGTSQKWNGVNIEGTPSPAASLENVVIEYCNTAVRIRSDAEFSMDTCTVTHSGLGVDLYSTGVDEPPLITISNSTFSDVSNGIFIDNYSNLLLENNNISAEVAEELTAGISCYASSPDILGNTVQSFGRGIRCSNLSSPALEEVVPGGYNVIISNGTGVYCKDGSNAILGYVSGALGDEGGKNSIFDNSSYQVTLVNNCNVKAENNWWGTATPSSSLFSIGGSCTIDYKPYLTEDPNQGNRMGTLKALKHGEGDSPVNDLNGRGIWDAIEARVDGRFDEASAIAREIVGNRTLLQSVREWAIAELLAVAQRPTQNGISTYLIAAKNDNPSLTRVIDFALPHAYLDEGNLEAAMAAFDANIVRYPSTELEQNGLYGKFMICLGSDSLQAVANLALLESQYPESDEAYMARFRYDNSLLGYQRQSSLQDQKLQATLFPTGFHLGQNFPNPFNPSTTIRYELPEDNWVTLMLYDILGREVLTVLNGWKEAGYHKVLLDATALPSGVYLYRFNAGNFSDVKKLIILK